MKTLAALLLAVIASTALAQTNVRVRGTITALNGDVLAVKSRDGRDIQLHLAPEAQVVTAKATTLAEFKTGSYVGVASVKGPDGRLVANAPSPNGITLNKKGSQVYVAITRAQQIWRLPLMALGTPSKTGVAIQLSGGHAGPDGIERDDEDGLVVCHLGVGIWRFDSNCLPTHLVHAGKAHRLMTNIAFRGRTLYITDSANGEILTAEMPVAGKKMFSMR